MIEFKSQFLDIEPNSDMESLAVVGTNITNWVQGVPWWMGDLARYAESRWPETWHQVFPEYVSPGMVQRCMGVAKAYPKPSDRNPDCTWTQHMQVVGKADRQQRLREIAEKGLTTDESRQESRQESTTKPTAPQRWLLAIDCNYHVHRHWHSGAETAAAKQVSGWIERTVERLKEKGLTDAVCCFDSRKNFRRELTAEWADRYKDRGEKDPELSEQIYTCQELLIKRGFLCVSHDGFEADDVIASYCESFPGRVTIVSQDKDLRQCLNGRVNMLTSVEWSENPDTGKHVPEYHWLSSTQHAEETGLIPEQWPDWQCIAGDNVDGIKGVPGIGAKGATDLLKEFATLDAVLLAATNPDCDRLKSVVSEKKIESLRSFAQERLAVTRELVTLRRDLPVDLNTRICLPSGKTNHETIGSQMSR